MSEVPKRQDAMEPGETSREEELKAAVTESASTSEDDRDADLIAQKDEEIRQLKDRVLRLSAEMENTRKRLERERSEGIAFANECLIRELLPVLDNLERAIQHAENETGYQNLVEGIRMTMKAFLDVLGKFGCAPFESTGKVFDPNFHEAIMQRDDPEKPGKTVLEELQKGYTLHGRLLRPALVVVSRNVNHGGEG